MTTTELKTRIEKAEEKANKKRNTIAKKTAMISKKEETAKSKYNVIDLANYDRATDTEHDDETKIEIAYIKCDIKYLTEDINRLHREIEETNKTIEKYKMQLRNQETIESIYTKEVPESLKELETKLANDWYEYDMKRREFIRQEREKYTYKEFIKKYSFGDLDLIMRTPNEIKKANAKEAKMFVLGLYNRVKEITGTVTNWDHIRLEQGNAGPVLTGVVIGKEGRASVETITAGGYNIQRLHIRTLVHPIN